MRHYTSWGTYKYYFASTHTDSTTPADNVLVQAIQVINIASPVPEPSTYAAIVALGGIGLVTYARRRSVR